MGTGVLALRTGPAAAAGPLACFDDQHNGPCMTPDPAAFFPARGKDPAVMAANFALVFPGTGAVPWEYVCDDLYGRPAPERIRRSPNGELLLPTTVGLKITRDGCAFENATWPVPADVVYDVAVDSKNPLVVFALMGTPRVLMRSGDMGRSFTAVSTFPSGLLLSRVILPPARSKEVYVMVRGRGASTPLFLSTDDGATFSMRDPSMGASTPVKTAFEMLEPHPTDPATLYFTLILTDGDELWKTTDAGLTSSRVLKLNDAEALGGLAFGASPNTLYVGGRNLYPERGMPAGHLYISRDGGATWLPPVAASESGPQFNCLVAAGAELYACGVGASLVDDMMVASSSDEGKTWKTISRLGDLNTPKTCTMDRCAGVSDWLCNTYTTCAAGKQPVPVGEPPPAPDGGGVLGTGGQPGGAMTDASVDVRLPTATDDGGGCGCRIGSRSAVPTAAAVALLLLALALLLGRGPRR
jgi:hypothetical protein